MNSQLLVFRLPVGENPNMKDIYGRFNPGGQIVLNATEWRGKAPRTCGVTNVHGKFQEGGPSAFVVEVTCKPKGFISYAGQTRYDGWTAMALERGSDGVLLNSTGGPLKDGEPPLYSPKEVYRDIDFNELDFGEFVEEKEIEDVKRVARESVTQGTSSGRISVSTKGKFMAAHRSRPMTKIVLSNAPSGRGRDGFGTQVININLSTPHLEFVLTETLTSLMCSFIEGKVSIKNFEIDGGVFVELSDALVDCEPNEQGENSWFNVLHYVTPIGFMQDLARKLQAWYQVEASVVEGPHGGVVLRQDAK